MSATTSSDFPCPECAEIAIDINPALDLSGFDWVEGKCGNGHVFGLNIQKRLAVCIRPAIAKVRDGPVDLNWHLEPDEMGQ